MTSISNWYNQSYSTSFARTSRLRAPSLLPPRGAPAPTPAAQQTLVVDAAAGAAAADKDDKDKGGRRRETIFGPDVGEDEGGGWTPSEGGHGVDVETVRKWVERAKSEDGLHPTTTLQALVNLKRPSLLLQPLEIADEAGSAAGEPGESAPAAAAAPPLHALKFNYDATVARVQIAVSLHAAPADASEAAEAAAAALPPLVVYSGAHVGGFNQTFTLPPAHALDLSPAIALPAEGEGAGEAEGADDDGKRDAAPAEHANARTRSEDTQRTSLERASTHAPDLSAIPELPDAAAASAVPPAAAGPDEARLPGRRFGIFGRRHREPDVEAQIEMADRTAEAGASEGDKKDEVEKGMRLLIRIEAVGEDGQVLPRRNAQLTHILINGMLVPDAGSNNASGAGKRVWVVKVVRREAVIGAHTFALKEIYGLSSATSQASSYPPTSEDPYASTLNECIVCLTSPRDVVLLPCRHLVVCRECAVGMVEFGAGGKVARRDDAEPVAAEGLSGATGAAGETAAAGAEAAAPAPAATTTRRKKKAKGWYCPVCRQPYTSLLRLALPPPKASHAPSLHTVRSTHSLHSLRSVRTTRTTRSLAPSLPAGAEHMLEALRPPGANDDDDDAHADADDDDKAALAADAAEEAVPTLAPAVGTPPEHEDVRPQFVIAEDLVRPDKTEAAVSVSQVKGDK
ncbi:hypothetical protein Q5752_002587 [Cryptotrichosporon argae]